MIWGRGRPQWPFTYRTVTLRQGNWLFKTRATVLQLVALLLTFPIQRSLLVVSLICIWPWGFMFTKGNSFVFVIKNRTIGLSKDNKINLISTIVWCFDLSGWTWNLQEGSGRQCLCCGDALRLLSDITCCTDLCLFSSLVNVYFTAK